MESVFKTIPWLFLRQLLLDFFCLDHEFDTAFCSFCFFCKGLILIALFYRVIDPVQSVLDIMVHDVYQTFYAVLVKLNQARIEGVSPCVQCICTGGKFAAAGCQRAGRGTQFFAPRCCGVDSLSQLVGSGYQTALPG